MFKTNSQIKFRRLYLIIHVLKSLKYINNFLLECLFLHFVHFSKVYLICISKLKSIKDKNRSKQKVYESLKSFKLLPRNLKT